MVFSNTSNSHLIAASFNSSVVSRLCLCPLIQTQIHTGSLTPVSGPPPLPTLTHPSPPDSSASASLCHLSAGWQRCKLCCFKYPCLCRAYSLWMVGAKWERWRPKKKKKMRSEHTVFNLTSAKDRYSRSQQLRRLARLNRLNSG